MLTMKETENIKKRLLYLLFSAKYLHFTDIQTSSAIEMFKIIIRKIFWDIPQCYKYFLFHLKPLTAFSLRPKLTSISVQLPEAALPVQPSLCLHCFHPPPPPYGLESSPSLVPVPNHLEMPIIKTQIYARKFIPN